jgi:hypothetical protein
MRQLSLVEVTTSTRCTDRARPFGLIKPSFSSSINSDRAPSRNRWRQSGPQRRHHRADIRAIQRSPLRCRLQQVSGKTVWSRIGPKLPDLAALTLNLATSDSVPLLFYNAARTAALACSTSSRVTASLASGIVGPDTLATHQTASFNEGCASCG